MKDTCWNNENRTQALQIIQTQYYSEMCQEITPHDTRNFLLNLKNVAVCWCNIYEENTYDTKNYVLKMKNKPNHHILCQTSTTHQKQQPMNTYRNDTYNHRGGYRGHGWYNNDSGEIICMI